MPDNPLSSHEESPRVRTRGTMRSLLLLAIFAWTLRSLIVSPFNIPSGSMLPTLAIGDYLFVSKWPYGFSRYSFPLQIPAFSGRVLGRLPDRGDVVIFRLPGKEQEDWVKRVIGLPGDRIAVSGGAVILNGVPLQRVAAGEVAVRISPNSPCRPMPLARTIVNSGGHAACLIPAYRETLPNGPSYMTLNGVDGGPGDNFPEVVVPPGHMFVMGDNRDDSEDSRFPRAQGPQGGVGFLPVDHLVGRAAFAFWSTDGSASYWKPWTWVTALRFERIGTSYHR